MCTVNLYHECTPLKIYRQLKLKETDVREPNNKVKRQVMYQMGRQDDTSIGFVVR